MGHLSLSLTSVCRTISVDNQVQAGDINLYEGLRCHGVPLVTISRGRLVYENGMFTCAAGSGKFCPLRTFPDYLYKKMVQREKVSHTTGFMLSGHLLNSLLFIFTTYIHYTVKHVHHIFCALGIRNIIINHYQ